MNNINKILNWWPSYRTIFKIIDFIFVTDMVKKYENLKDSQKEIIIWWFGWFFLVIIFVIQGYFFYNYNIIKEIFNNLGLSFFMSFIFCFFEILIFALLFVIIDDFKCSEFYKIVKRKS